VTKKVDFDGTHLIISFSTNDRNDFADMLDSVKTNVSGRWFDKDNRVWKAPYSKKSIEFLKGMEFDFSERVEVRKKKSKKEKQRLLDIEQEIQAAYKSVVIDEWKLDKRIRNFQKEAVQFMEWRKGRAIVADEMGCIDGEAVISINRGGNGKKVKIKDAYARFKGISCRHNWDKEIKTYCRCLKEDLGIFGLNEVVDILYKGKREIIEIVLQSGKVLKLTPDHEVLGVGGQWKRIDSFSVGDSIVVNGGVVCKQCSGGENIITYKYSKFIGYCKPCMYKCLRTHKNDIEGIKKIKRKDGYVYLVGKGVRFHKRKGTSGVLEHVFIMENYLGRDIDFSKEEIHHINEIKDDNRIENLRVVSKSEHKHEHKAYARFGNFRHNNGNEIVIVPKEDVILEIRVRNEFIDVYDLVMDDPYRNFVVNGIVVHNCGKTCESLNYVRLHDEFKKILIVCPATLKINWSREIFTWTGCRDVHVFQGRTQTYIDCDRYRFFIINYDILQNWVDFILKLNFDIVIADEAHYLGNSKAIRTVSFREMCEKIDKVLFLSGTPIKNRPAEFYTMLSMVAPDVFSDQTAFLFRYCGPQHNGFGYSFKGATHQKELRELILPYMIRREKSEVLTELPGKIKNVIYLSSTAAEYKKYTNAVKNFKDILGYSSKNKLELQNNIEAVKQAAYEAKKSSVYKWIDDFLMSDQKLVVFAYHRKAIDELYEKYRDIAVRVYGGVSMQDRQKSIDSFQEKEEVKMFICQIKAAEGFNLTAASNVAILEFTWVPADHEQAVDRCDRIGQKFSVNVYYLIAENTIEDKLVKMLQKKKRIVSGLINGEEEDFISEEEIMKGVLEELVSGSK
jgi:superfamily II DNA or RNA helicase